MKGIRLTLFLLHSFFIGKSDKAAPVNNPFYLHLLKDCLWSK